MAKSFSVSVNIGGRLDSSLGAAVRKAESRISGLARHVQTINARTQSTITNFGRGVASAGKKLQEAGRTFSTNVSAPAGLLAFGAGRMAFEFEKAGNLLEALGDASEDQRKKFEGLANELNKKYPQSLAEIIKTGNEMLKGGFSFDQMTGAIDQTLATAVLGDMAPSEVGDMMARTINSFQMPMKTYEDAMKSSVQVSDRMTYAAVKTTASLKDMGEMFRYVGGAMSASGNDLDTATAFAMAFAKNGTVGSEAGVALRSAVVRMVKMPAKGEAALNRIGMSLNKYVGGKTALTSDRILGGLSAGGIDASGIKGQIDGLLKNKKLAASPAKLQTAITKAVQRHLGSSSAVDAATIAENVNDSIAAAGNKIDLMGFFRDLKSKIDKGEATLGDVATILEGRHFSRYQAILQSDLDGLLAGIQGESNGYTQARYKTALKGPVGAWYEFEAAIEKLSVTLGRVAFTDFVSGFSRVVDAIQSLSEANPKLLKFTVYAGLASIALGPLMMAAGATARAVGLLATGLLSLGRAATVGLAAQLVTVAGGVRALAVATVAGAAGRLRGMAAGLIALNAVGGSTAVLGAIGGSILSFGRAVLMFPVTALRAIGGAMWALVANPIGALITAIVVALTALGVWIYNNWAGITSFFDGFVQGFEKALGPTAKGWVDGLVSSISAVWKWISDLLGPIQATNAEWKSWGETVGGVVAGAVNAIGNGIERVVGLFTSAYDKAVALKDAIAGLWGGGSSAATSAPEVAGARARGGPVTGGRTYLVGENGPELFTAPASGEIIPNDRLQALASPDRIASATSRPGSGGRGDMSISFEINGATDPQEVARICEQKFRDFLWRLESEQRALLSD
ncbi:phage tail tape measure protein [Microvirga thermotolerans]|nr:phage tail tape measure protein [Microvirga thermotolerans]